MSSRLIEFDDAEHEALVDIALAEIDELPGGALGIRHLQRARLLQVLKFGREAGRAIERAGFVEGAADIGEFLRRRDDDPGERSAFPVRDIRLMSRTPKSVSMSRASPSRRNVQRRSAACAYSPRMIASNNSSLELK